MTDGNDKLAAAIQALEAADDIGTIVAALFAIIEALTELLEETMESRKTATDLLGEAIAVAREAIEAAEAKP
jgi:predicted outer membrane lipoprotein